MDSEQQRRSGRRSRSASEDEPVADRFAFSAGTGGRKSSAKKSTAKKTTAKPAAKKTTAKKPTAKAPTAKKPTAKAPTAKKPTAKAPTAKKPTAKKPTAKAPTAKKPTAKKPTAKKPTAKKPTAKKPTARTRAAEAPPAPVVPPEVVEPVVAPPVTEEVAPEAPTVVAPTPAAPTDEGEAPRFAAATRGRPAVPAPPAPPAREPVRAPAPTRPEPIGPTPAAYRRRRTALALVGLAVVGALVWAGVYFTSGDDEVTPTPTGPVVTPTGSPTSPGPTVGPVASAAFPGEAVAEEGSLQAVPLGQRDEKCITHTFDGTSAYLSDCTDWGNQSDILYFFYVTVENPTDQSLTLRRSAFVLTTSTGTLRPVGVADRAADPTTFIAKSQTINAGGSRSGYLVFETEGTFSPEQLTYEQGELSLTITFEGQENVRPRA